MTRSMIGLLALLLMWGCEEGGANLNPGDDDASDDDDDASDDDDTGDDDTGDDDTGDDDTGDDDDDTVAGEVTLTPALDFGDVEAGCSAELEMQIANGTQETVVVVSGTVDEGSVLYSLELEGGWGTSLEAGEQATLTVDFHPDGMGVEPGTLEVTTNHPDYESLGGTMTGTGITGGPGSDQYTQTINEQVDIVWVVDNSCSMLDDQAFLASNAADFLDYLTTEGVDYQMGVMTVEDGAVLGYGVMDPSTPNVADELAGALQVGSGGMGIEMPFQYGYEAVTSPLTDPGGANEGLVRPNAGLALIIVTDEDDGSGGDPATWTSDFQALKPDPTRVLVNGIYGGSSGCPSASAGPRIAAVIAGTGGVEVSICDVDWLPVLSQIPDLVTGLSDTFPLTSVPLDGMLEVSLDGTPTYTGWYYDGIYNAVVFEAAYIPAEDTVIEITYDLMGC